ncbi:doublesex- and mab-3-related transcription factor C1 [Oryctolagus cuniculus]|uniref:Doublesex- and mab-3-related transcription factor C1/C2 C-terminal domain-containing protein n=1 Tax=Oryctolagus cuniculus TaxID=9986 RepID=U3KM46_RABIT|nr:doublesex- and mab-3-related transcription factor C1 [Oryctolagus cuniculus]
MDPQEMPAVPSCPSNFEYNAMSETRGTWGLQFVPRGAAGLSDPCHSYGISTTIGGQERICHFRACQCHNCVFSEPCMALPAMNTLRREQGPEPTKQLTHGVIKSMPVAPGAPVHIKNTAVEAGVHTGKVDVMPQPQAYPCYTPNLGTSPGMFSHPPEPTFPPSAPVTMDLPRVFANSGQPQWPHLPDQCSSLTHQPCATLDPFQLQPQVPKAPELALVAASEWQQKLEAAEALLTLRNSFLVPREPMTLAQPRGLPDPAGERVLQSPFPALCPRPATSNSLSGGHLGWSSL